MTERCEGRTAKGRRCASPATPEGTAKAGGIPCCGHPAHVKALLAGSSTTAQVRNGLRRDGDGAGDGDGVAAAPAAAPDAPGLGQWRAFLERLPSDEPAAGPAPAVPPAAGPAAERAALRLLGDDAAAAADPGEADAAALEEADELERKKARRAILEEVSAGSFPARRCSMYLRLICDPVFRRAGKETLTPEELEEGGELAAAFMADVWGSAMDSPRRAFTLWVVLVFGSRFFDEAFLILGHLIRGLVPGQLRTRLGGRSAEKPTPERPARPTRDETETVAAGSSWPPPLEEVA